MKSINEIIPQIQQWASDRGLLDGDPDKQVLKLQEELGELTAAYNKQQLYELKDSFGDLFVAMVISATQQGIDLAECINDAYNVIHNRIGETRNGVFIKKADLKK